MITEEIRSAIAKRSETNDEWTFGVEQCLEKEVEILCRNVEDAIYFLDNECSADEFSWLSEVFEDVAKKTKSKAFTECLHRVAEKYPEECKEYHIDLILEYADSAILDTEDNQ